MSEGVSQADTGEAAIYLKWRELLLIHMPAVPSINDEPAPVTWELMTTVLVALFPPEPAFVQRHTGISEQIEEEES